MQVSHRKFDIHAMIYSEDAPALEKAIHKELADTQVNKVNNRKEFFNVDLDIIENAALKHGATFKMTKLAEAREYRQSIGEIDG